MDEERPAVAIAWESSGDGFPLVLVHGLSEDRRAWDPLVPLLEDDFRVVRLDLRGHGGSDDADDYGALGMAADVATVVTDAALEVPPIVVGHSLGAFVVTAYAASAPVHAVVNLDQSLRLGDFAAALQPLGATLRSASFAETFDAILESLGHDGLGSAELAYARERHRSARQEVVLGVWDQVLSTPADELTALAAAVLREVTVPYVAVHGSDPGSGYVEWLEGVLPAASVEIWRGGHYPHLVEPQRFAALLLSLVS